MLTQLDIKESPDGVTVKVKVQPRAAKNEICGIMEDALRVRLTSPPVDGEANAACAAFLGKFFGIAKSKVTIVSGHTARIKTIKLDGISKAQLFDRLKNVIG
jgi:uncharacterized protein (TIGR00251 family)